MIRGIRAAGRRRKPWVGLALCGLLLPMLPTGLTRLVSAAEASHPLADSEGEALLAHFADVMGEVRSFEAPFVQEHHLSAFLDVLKARGISYFRAPDQFRWELLEPYHSLLVYNRDQVAKFDVRDGKLQYVESGAYDAIRGLMGQLTSWMRGDFRATREGFSVKVYEGSEYEIALTPRSEQMLRYIQRIEVYLRKDPIQAARIRIREPEQDFIEIRFDEVRENAPLRPELFDSRNPWLSPPSP